MRTHSACHIWPVSRLYLLAQGIEFEDVLFTFKEWGSSELKRVVASGDSPFGYLPTVTVDGRTYSESIAIARYFARKVALCLSSMLPCRERVHL